MNSGPRPSGTTRTSKEDDKPHEVLKNHGKLIYLTEHRVEKKSFKVEVYKTFTIGDKVSITPMENL